MVLTSARRATGAVGEGVDLVGVIHPRRETASQKTRQTGHHRRPDDQWLTRILGGATQTADRAGLDEIVAGDHGDPAALDDLFDQRSLRHRRGDDHNVGPQRGIKGDQMQASIQTLGLTFGRNVGVGAIDPHATSVQQHPSRRRTNDSQPDDGNR